MPYVFGGIPLLAMIDNGVLYPLNWLLIPFVRDGALSFYLLELQTLAHVFLLGLGAYCFARTVGVSRAGAFLAGVCWMFSGRVLAGHPQVFLYVAYAMGLYYVVSVAGRVQTSGEWMAAMRSTGLFLVVLALGLALAAAAFLPAYELAGLSARGATTPEVLEWGTRDFRNLVTFVAPEFFGQMGPTAWDYWGPAAEEYGYYWEIYVYLGMVPLLLAGAALTLVRRRLTLFLGLLTTFCLIGILGETTPFPRLLHTLAPGFGMFRAHTRLGLVMGFAVAILAGMGLDALRASWADQQLRARLRRYLTVTTGIALVLGLGAVLSGGPLTGWLGGDETGLLLARAGFGDPWRTCGATSGAQLRASVGLAPAAWAWRHAHRGDARADRRRPLLGRSVVQHVTAGARGLLRRDRPRRCPSGPPPE